MNENNNDEKLSLQATFCFKKNLKIGIRAGSITFIMLINRSQFSTAQTDFFSLDGAQL